MDPFRCLSSRPWWCVTAAKYFLFFYILSHADWRIITVHKKSSTFWRKWHIDPMRKWLYCLATFGLNCLRMDVIYKHIHAEEPYRHSLQGPQLTDEFFIFSWSQKNLLYVCRSEFHSQSFNVWFVCFLKINALCKCKIKSTAISLIKSLIFCL